MPAVLFSEVMRGLDLVVSVAHVGGAGVRGHGHRHDLLVGGLLLQGLCGDWCHYI